MLVTAGLHRLNFLKRFHPRKVVKRIARKRAVSRLAMISPWHVSYQAQFGVEV
jgi:hypothetical protein